MLGTLLKFSGPKSTVASARAKSGNAQILIFTGVRYERQTPPPPTTELDTKRRKRKRG
jgi:hypothetical protein